MTTDAIGEERDKLEDLISEMQSLKDDCDEAYEALESARDATQSAGVASMHSKPIRFFGRPVVLACDGRCDKAWGISVRPREHFDPDEPDDYAFLADDELGKAPDAPGTFEGGDSKPAGPHAMNRWCARECERSTLTDAGQSIVLADFSRRVFNQPSKHQCEEES